MSADRWFRRLLRLLPFDFRADYGEEMARVFREQQRDAVGRGQRARMWLDAVRAMMSIGPREHVEQLRQDVAYACRGMRRQPGFVAVAIVTLALGIGANTAIFSVVHAVLLAPLPYADPERLLHVTNLWGEPGGAALSDPEYLDYREGSRTLDIAAMAGTSVNIGGGSGDPERVPAVQVTPNTFDVLGMQPAVGRVFPPDAGTRADARVVIVSDALWRRRFGPEASLEGRTLDVNGVRHDIIGVLPAGASLPIEVWARGHAQVVLPLGLDPAAPRHRRGGHYLFAVARMRPGATQGGAQADMDGVVAPLIARYPEEHDQGPYFRIGLQPLREVLLGPARPAVLMLAGAVGLVLLIACANVANLMLARGEARRRELAVRAALGASRFRVARQLVTESCVLSLAGAAAGIAVALWIVQGVQAIGPEALPRIADAKVNAPVLVFAALIGVVTGLVFGLAPATQGSRARMSESLKEGSRGSTGARAAARQALVVAQVAIAAVLLVGGALLARSFFTLLAVPSGLDPRGVLTLRVSLPQARYPGLAEVSAFYTRLLERVRSLPGVAGAGAASGLPLAIASGDWGFDIEGWPRVNGRRPGAADWFVVTPGYFETLGIGLVSGRLPAASDTAGGPPVIFLNEAAVRAIFGGRDPVGTRIRLSSTTGGEQPWRTIAGILRDVRTRGLDTPLRPEMFIPYEQFQHFAAGVQARSMTIVLRAPGDPIGLAPSVRAELRALDPQIAAADVRDMRAVVSGSVADRRLHVVLVGSFALLALGLAAVGVYGVMAFHVLQRTREVGVRLALGASRGDVMRLVVGQGMRLVLAGLGLGLAAAFVLSRSMSSLLYGISPRDLAVYTLAPLVLGLIGLAACCIPARRAMRVDPVVALRAE